MSVFTVVAIILIVITLVGLIAYGIKMFNDYWNKQEQIVTPYNVKTRILVEQRQTDHGIHTDYTAQYMRPNGKWYAIPRYHYPTEIDRAKRLYSQDPERLGWQKVRIDQFIKGLELNDVPPSISVIEHPTTMKLD